MDDGNYKILEEQDSGKKRRRMSKDDMVRCADISLKPCRYCGMKPHISSDSSLLGGSHVLVECQCGYGDEVVADFKEVVEKWNKLQEDTRNCVEVNTDFGQKRLYFETPEEAKAFYNDFISGDRLGLGCKNEFIPMKRIDSVRLAIPIKDMDESMKGSGWCVPPRESTDARTRDIGGSDKELFARAMACFTLFIERVQEASSEDRGNGMGLFDSLVKDVIQYRDEGGDDRRDKVEHDICELLKWSFKMA